MPEKEPRGLLLLAAEGCDDEYEGRSISLVNLDEKRQEKMGYIRKLCRDQKKQQQQQGQESDVKMEEEDLEERFAPEN